MPGIGVVLGADTAGALPTGADGGKARGMHGVKRATVHHVRTVENQQIGEQPFEEARLCRFSPSLCASREILVVDPNIGRWDLQFTLLFFYWPLRQLLRKKSPQKVLHHLSCRMSLSNHFSFLPSVLGAGQGFSDILLMRFLHGK
jgi:hypothetical protein